MNRSEVRLLQRVATQENRRWSSHLSELPRDQWPASYTLESSRPVLRVWRSRDYIVVAYSEAHGVIRLSIMRTVVGEDGRVLDGVTWDELQRIKTACGFVSQDAVEVYPPARDVVDVANMRHLWILPDRLPFVWRDRP